MGELSELPLSPLSFFQTFILANAMSGMPEGAAVADEGMNPANVVLVLVGGFVTLIIGGLIALNYYAQQEGIAGKQSKKLTAGQKLREKKKEAKKQQRVGRGAE